MKQVDKKIETKQPDAILFDLGGTLLHDSNSSGLSTRVRFRLESEAFVPFVEKDLNLPAALADAMDATYRDGLKESHLRKWLESQLHQSSSNSAASPEELERLIRSKVISYSPPEDDRRVLRELLRLDMPMGVVSNSIFSSDLLRSDLQELSVLEAFRFVVSSAEFGLRKPHPAIFEAAVGKLKVTPAATWYVGDLWENDVVGSRGVGLVPLWLNANDMPPPVPIPHIRAKSWAELGNLIGL
jgi:HAD superfamily hydrolase (TIGR01549 family)